LTHSLLQTYERLVQAGSMLPDKDQLAAVRSLQVLSLALQHTRQPSLWQRLWRTAPGPGRGIYLWGGVGRGKTWLMDLFYDTLPVQRKRRTHFHRFMQGIHHELKSLDGVQNPLAVIAARWAKTCEVLCLDEFFVTDIADAMLLAGLLENLFAEGIILVTTSNLEPDALYRNGLQRARFLPAIALIKRHTEVLHLPGHMDFRLRILQQSGIYHWPLDAHARQAMRSSFERMAAACELERTVMLNDRPFNSLRRGDGVIWFTFKELCQQARGAGDFIEIARAFNTVLLSDVPQLREEDADAARRFITLVDEFYDRGVKLLLTAQVPLESLYVGQRLAFEFQRTVSRLTEMQTQDYLARPHLA
jgi:cell division protein ZapE